MVKIQKRNPAFDNLLNWVIIGFAIAVLIAVVSLLASTMIKPSTRKADNHSEAPSTRSTGSTPVANSTAASSDGTGTSSECLSDAIKNKLIELVRSEIGLDSELTAATADVIASGQSRVSCVAKITIDLFFSQNQCGVALVKRIDDLKRLYPELLDNNDFLNGNALAISVVNRTKREADIFPAYFIDHGEKNAVILRGFYHEQDFVSAMYRVKSPKQDADRPAEINELEKWISIFDLCKTGNIAKENDLINAVSLIGSRYERWFKPR
jgi:hypothetical protein